jgi:hypothetical protein
MTNQGPKGTGDEAEPTMLVQLHDPGLAQISKDFSDDNLLLMQAALARCSVAHVDDGLLGFNFKGFVQNLRGLGKVEVEGVRLYTLLTRNNAFILSNLIAEELHDLVRGFMDLHLGARITLQDGNKFRYLYRVPSKQIDKLRTIINQNRLMAARGFPFQDVEQFKKRLAGCTVTSEAFDLSTFAASVRSVSNVYEDAQGNQYHHVMVGEPEVRWALYVAPRAPIPKAIALNASGTPLALLQD